ncbi:hypothetical protein TWF718_002782 [Orbilia javanica]|uniref:Uncharacterized protein n=1 Tax=Orbilia javanica TaxID=47235 RepID=A0AAN8MEZ4_9PEZI
MDAKLMAEIIKERPLAFEFSLADPLAATDDILISYGLPTRPDEDSQPLYYSQWKRLITQRLKFIPSKTGIVDQGVSSCADSQQPKPTFTKSTADGKSETWSGAVTQRDSENSIRHVGATWIVPQLYPPADQNANSFDFGLWVGVDNHTHGDDTLLQAGTVHTCKVDSEGRIEKEFFAFYNLYGDHFTRVDGFPVNPGDTVSVFLNLLHVPKLGANYLELSGTTWAWIIYVNESVGSYTIRCIKLSSNETEQKAFKADSAEWILDNKNLQFKLAAFGSAVMFNCFAVTEEGGEVTIANSELISMVRDGVCVSRASRIGDQAVGLSYGGIQRKGGNISD